MKFYRKPSGLIMLQINDAQFVNGKFYYSTKEYCNKEDWDNPKGFTKEIGSALNVRLFEILSKSTDYIRLNRSRLTQEGLKAALDSTSPKEMKVERQQSLIEEYQDYLYSVKGTVQEESYQTYHRSYEIFKGYLQHKSIVVITPDKFNFKHYQQYLNYLKNEVVHTTKKKDKVKGFDTNTVAKCLKHFKRFLQYLSKMEVKVGFELDEISYKEVPGIKLSWSEDELFRLDMLQLSGIIDEARDLTLIQCHTGVRISDLFRIDLNVLADKIKIETKKVVGNFISIPMTATVKRIMEKYNHKLPKMSEPTYREYIKKLYKMVNPDSVIQVRKNGKFTTRYVWEEISSHDNVRTFITLSANRGMPIQTIAQITGKTVKVLLSNYLVEDQNIAEKAMMDAWNAPMKIAK
jgi:hypothetical protein